MGTRGATFWVAVCIGNLFLAAAWLLYARTVMLGGLFLFVLAATILMVQWRAAVPRRVRVVTAVILAAPNSSSGGWCAILCRS